jgi:hypothetical protein
MMKTKGDDMNFKDFSSTDLLDLAKKVDALVTEKLQGDLSRWKEDIRMRQMFAQDCADGLAVCELLLSGDRAAVAKRLNQMDTAPREYIIEFIEEIAGDDFFDILLKND